jgi:hypothetical protein
VVPLEGQISISELADLTSLSEPRLRTVLRQVMVHHMFYEPREDYVAHTAMSSLLVSNPGAMDWIGHVVGDALPATAKFTEALKAFGNTDKDNETAFNLAFNTKENCMRYIGSRPLEAKRFGGALAFGGGGGAASFEGVVGISSWAKIGAAKIVDVS